MNRRVWLWTAVLGLPLAVTGGLVYANSQKTEPYICPLTGEQLPCEKCCPLNCCPDGCPDCCPPDAQE